MAVILKCLLTLSIVGHGGESTRVRLDVTAKNRVLEHAGGLVSDVAGSQLTINAEKTSRHNSSLGVSNKGHQPVMICKSSFHTYINLGDGGCFQHLLTHSGGFQDTEAQHSYEANFCPFAGGGKDHTKKRKLLANWFIRAMTYAAPPFTVNDLAMSCLVGDPKALSDDFLKALGVQAGNASSRSGEDVFNKEEFCETMLSLPLMFESIGFDGPGVLMEDAHIKTVWTYKAQVQNTDDWRPGPSSGCDSWRASDLGTSPYARLALRAILPTYFRHRYMETGGGMVGRGAKAILLRGMFTEAHWQSQVKAVCSAAAVASQNLDALFSLQSLQTGGLLSQAALHRDSGQCADATPCNYPADPTHHLGACDVCAQKEFPWYDPNRGNCWDAQTSDTSRQVCATPDAPTKTCSCHKAICWYFTDDFEAALSVANQECGKR